MSAFLPRVDLVECLQSYYEISGWSSRQGLARSREAARCITRTNPPILGESEGRCHRHVSYQFFQGSSAADRFEGRARAERTWRSTSLSATFVRAPLLPSARVELTLLRRTADLTDEEIAAIDAAGAKGPRSLSRTDVLYVSLFAFQILCLLLLLYTCGWLYIPFSE